MAIREIVADPERLMAAEMLAALGTVFATAAIKNKSVPSSNQVVSVMLCYTVLAGTAMFGGKVGKFFSIIGALVLVSLLMQAFQSTSTGAGVAAYLKDEESAAQRRLNSVVASNPTAATLYRHLPPGAATNG